MLRGGYILWHRRIQSHWLYESNRPRTQLEAFMWLIMNAEYEDGYYIRRGKKTPIKRGQLAVTMQALADVWHWNDRRRVKRFLDLLAQDNLIAIHTSKLGSIIEIIDYDRYQGDGLQQRSQPKPQPELQPQPEIKATAEEKAILDELATIQGFNIKQADVPLIRGLKNDFPDVDLLAEAKKFAIYRIDKPLTEKANPRFMFRRWIENANKWRKENNENDNNQHHGKHTEQDSSHKVVRYSKFAQFAR